VDAGNDSMYLAIPGNHHPWPIIGPFAAFILLIAYVGSRRRASTRRHNPSKPGFSEFPCPKRISVAACAAPFGIR
jgi:hypothetical protein